MAHRRWAASVRAGGYSDDGSSKAASLSYQTLDQGHFDYAEYAVPGISRQLLRGPAVSRARPYFVCIGAAQTFGRFVHRPYPQLLAQSLGLQALNFGVAGS